MRPVSKDRMLNSIPQALAAVHTVMFSKLGVSQRAATHLYLNGSFLGNRHFSAKSGLGFLILAITMIDVFCHLDKCKL